MAGSSSRFGTSSTEWDLFLKTYGGEALAAFLEKTVMSDKVRTRRVSGAKSATFPRIGTASATYHTPGQNILEDGSYESTPATGESVVAVDHILLSTILINDIDEALSHYDVRGPYARNQAHALAKQLDQNLMQVCASGAATSAVSGWDGGGQTVLDDDFESGGSDGLASIEEAARKLDQDDVPQENRHLIVSPTAFHALRSQETVASTDYNANTGGDVGKGTWLAYAGFKIHMSNIVESSAFRDDHSGGTTGQKNAAYDVDCSNVLAVFFQEEGIGHVRAIDLQVEGEYHQLYQGTVMTARMACGSSVLYPSACGVIKSS